MITHIYFFRCSGICLFFQIQVFFNNELTSSVLQPLLSVSSVNMSLKLLLTMSPVNCRIKTKSHFSVFTWITSGFPKWISYLQISVDSINPVNYKTTHFKAYDWLCHLHGQNFSMLFILVKVHSRNRKQARYLKNWSLNRDNWLLTY